MMDSSHLASIWNGLKIS